MRIASAPAHCTHCSEAGTPDANGRLQITPDQFEAVIRKTRGDDEAAVNAALAQAMGDSKRLQGQYAYQRQQKSANDAQHKAALKEAMDLALQNAKQRKVNPQRK